MHEKNLTTFLGTLAPIGENTHTKTYEKKSYIYNQEDKANNAFLVLEGRIRIGYLNRNGNYVALREAKIGEFTGLAELILGRDYLNEAVALEESRIMSISRRHLDKLVESDTIEAIVKEELPQECYGLYQHLEMLTAKNLRTRLILYLQREVEKAPSANSEDGVIRRTHEEIGYYIDISRAYVTGELQILKEEGLIISQNQGRFKLDVGVLRKLYLQERKNINMAVLQKESELIENLKTGNLSLEELAGTYHLLHQKFQILAHRDSHSRVSLYLKYQIQNRGLPISIPTSTLLSRELNYSHGPVWKTYKRLEENGLIKRISKYERELCNPKKLKEIKVTEEMAKTAYGEVLLYFQNEIKSRENEQPATFRLWRTNLEMARECNLSREHFIRVISKLKNRKLVKRISWAGLEIPNVGRFLEYCDKIT